MKTDKHLKADVEAELGWEPSIAAAHVGVAAEGGVVTLTGHVRSHAEKSMIERLVSPRRATSPTASAPPCSAMRSCRPAASRSRCTGRRSRSRARSTTGPTGMRRRKPPGRLPA